MPMLALDSIANGGRGHKLRECRNTPHFLLGRLAQWMLQPAFNRIQHLSLTGIWRRFLVIVTNGSDDDAILWLCNF